MYNIVPRCKSQQLQDLPGPSTWSLYTHHAPHNAADIRRSDLEIYKPCYGGSTRTRITSDAEHSLPRVKRLKHTASCRANTRHASAAHSVGSSQIQARKSAENLIAILTKEMGRCTIPPICYTDEQGLGTEYSILQRSLAA